ncbi:hypothetical protein ACFP1Z_24025 [Streptomyces gamaensis]|uniref:Uncharacterized protein n=1 Tax=Streptomyces gamaensis TaxID=1763542 RepID=A0ABW0Z7E7_9ACTN
MSRRRAVRALARLLARVAPCDRRPPRPRGTPPVPHSSSAGRAPRTADKERTP